MLGERGDGAEADVRERADVEDRAAARQLLHEARIVDGADPVPDAVGGELLQRRAHRFGAEQLARVRRRAHASLVREREGAHERLVALRLEAGEPQPDDAALPVGDGVARDLLRLLGRVDPRNVGRQPHLHAQSLVRLACAVAVAAEDLVRVEAAPEPRREDRLEVDGAVAGRLGRVVDDDLAEVVVMRQGAGRQLEDLDEVPEVAVPVELGQIASLFRPARYSDRAATCEPRQLSGDLSDRTRRGRDDNRVAGPRPADIEQSEVRGESSQTDGV